VAASTYRIPLTSAQIAAANVGRQIPGQIISALDRLDAWIEAEGFRGWDPHDALNSPLLRRLTFGNRFLGIGWLQLLRRSPLNFRRLLAIPKGYNPKGMGLFLASYARKYALMRDSKHQEHILFLAQWLRDNAATGYSGACWGYNFAWPNRASFAPAGTPTIVNTAFIALAFLDLHLLCGNTPQPAVTPNIANASDGKPTVEWRATLSSALKTARSACDFILHDLNVLDQSSDELCFSYTPMDHRRVHNANMMGACLLASVFRQTGETPLAATALAAVRYTTRRQLPNGAWPYGQGAGEDWVDNFHTGFVLVALKRIRDCLQTDEFDESLHHGYYYWKQHMFLADGTPKYYSDKLYPIDVHSVAQAILTFLEFEQEDPEAFELAIRVAGWGIENLQDPDGYFYYWICRGYKIRIPYIRWAQAWMQIALTELVCSHRG